MRKSWPKKPIKCSVSRWNCRVGLAALDPPGGTLLRGLRAPSSRGWLPPWILNTKEICPDRTAIGVFPRLRNTHDMAYIANTPDDVRIMLGTIGLDSLDQLFDMVPPEFRLRRALDVAPALTELELTNHISGLLARNQGADQRVCFLGAGSYDHF